VPVTRRRVTGTRDRLPRRGVHYYVREGALPDGRDAVRLGARSA
jgi:hypothetical protein